MNDNTFEKHMGWMMVVCCLIPVVTLMIAAKVAFGWWIAIGVALLFGIMLWRKHNRSCCKEKHAATEDTKHSCH